MSVEFLEQETADSRKHLTLMAILRSKDPARVVLYYMKTLLKTQKSRIRETKNLLTDADSSTNHKVIHNFHLLYPYLRVIIFC